MAPHYPPPSISIEMLVVLGIPVNNCLGIAVNNYLKRWAIQLAIGA